MDMNEIAIRNAQNVVATMANELESLATRLRRLGVGLEDGAPHFALGEITATYMSSVGAIGSRLNDAINAVSYIRHYPGK